MSDESVKQFWDHIKDDGLIHDNIRMSEWDDLSTNERDSVKYIYHMAIGVMAENRR